MPLVFDAEDLVDIRLRNVHVRPEDFPVVAPEGIIVGLYFLFHVSLWLLLLLLPVCLSFILNDMLTGLEHFDFALDNNVEEITIFALAKQSCASVHINQLDSTRQSLVSIIVVLKHIFEDFYLLEVGEQFLLLLC